MKRFVLLVILAALAFIPGIAAAQSQVGSPVYIVPNITQSTGAYVTATPSDSNSVNKQLVITIPATPGNTVYLQALDFSYCNDAAGAVVTSNQPITVTGFINLPKFTAVSSAGTANTCASPYFMNWGAFPLRAITNTNVVITGPAANLHAATTMNAYALLAP